MYIGSLFFDIPSSGYVHMARICIFAGEIHYYPCIKHKFYMKHFISGVAGLIIIEILKNPALGLVNLAETLESIIQVVPHYSLSSALENMHKLYSINSICKSYIDKFGPLYQTYLCSVKHMCCSKYNFQTFIVIIPPYQQSKYNNI